MFLYCLFMFGFSAAEFLRPYDAINNNKKDLMNIIKSLKSFNENWNINKKVSKKVITNDVKEELSDVEKEKKLQELLWLLKKNYDAQEQYNLIHNPVHSGARVYFIRNPDAIDEYKKHLEQKKTRTSRQQNLKKKIQEFRRKENSGIMFRIPEETDEEPLTEGKLPVESMEIHNEKAHQNVRANNDFRHEKSDFDTNNDSGRERKRDSNILSKYHNIDSIKPETKADTYNYENNDLAKTNNKFDNKWDKTKNNEQFYKSDKLNKLSTNEYYIKKIVDDKPRLTPKKKPSYRNPQRELRQRNDLSPYMRTSIPYISKKGIYEDD